MLHANRSITGAASLPPRSLVAPVAPSPDRNKGATPIMTDPRELTAVLAAKAVA